MKKSKVFFIFCLLLFVVTAKAQMVLEYAIPTANSQIGITLGGTVNVGVDWGDGSDIETFTQAVKILHTYTSAGVKTVTITGTATEFGGEGISNENNFLTKVTSWEGLGLKSLSFAFWSAKILTEVPVTLPPTVTDLSYMFSGAENFNQNISSWNTSAITNMKMMFSGAKKFNQPIGNWNTAAVIDMQLMFDSATEFNQPIGDWNTSSVLFMSEMFQDAVNFNQPIGTWDTKNVLTTEFMFMGATSFNQPIGDWDLSSVYLIGFMFQDAVSFNQPIGDWDISSVKFMKNMFKNAVAFNQSIDAWKTYSAVYMNNMFEGAVAFNQPIGSWNMSNVQELNSMFLNAGLCTDNYDATLNGWASQTLKTGVDFDGGLSKYSTLGVDSRNTLINKGWSITDSGLGTSSDGKCNTTAIEKSLKADALNIYPNPATDKLHFNLTYMLNELITYSIYNNTGSILQEKEVQMDGKNIEIQLKDMLPGFYMLNLKTSKGSIVKSFVKE